RAWGDSRSLRQSRRGHSHCYPRTERRRQFVRPHLTTRTYLRPLLASRCERFECFGRQNFSLAALDQGPNVVGPQGEGIANLTLVAAAIVAPGAPALVATLMVEHGLDNVRLDSDVGHPGGNRPPNVMHRPSRYAGTPVERGLAVLPRPRGKAALGTLAEQR